MATARASSSSTDPAPHLLPRGARIAAMFIAVGCLAVLITAASITPSASGMGSHTQLGLSPCGWLRMFNKPCITCGYTTTFSLVAHGSWLKALINQPAAALAALACSAAFWLCAYAAITGARIERITAMFAKGWVLSAFGAAVVLAWGYKVWTYQPL